MQKREAEGTVHTKHTSTPSSSRPTRPGSSSAGCDRASRPRRSIGDRRARRLRLRAPRLVCGHRKQVSTVDTHEQWSGALSHRWRDAVTANFRFCAFTAFGLAALLCAPPQQFSGTARTETLLVTFVTEVSLRLAAPRPGGALIRRYIASRLALRSPDLFSSAPTTPAPPPCGGGVSTLVSFSFQTLFSSA